MAVDYQQSPEWKGYARRVLVWNWVTWILNFADRGLITPLLPLLILQFHLSLAESGALVSLFFVGYTSTFIGGYLSDKFGRKRVIGPSVIGFGAITSITAAANSVPFLGAVRVLTGVFEGFQYPAGAAWISETFAYRLRARALAIWETGYSLGTLGGIALATLIAARWGWRAPWPVVGGLSMIAGVLFLIYVKERPRTQTPAHQEAMVRTGSQSKARVRDAFKIRNVWVVFVLHGLYNFAFWAAAAFIPLYVEKIHHLTFISGGLLSAVLFGGITVGLLLSGLVADKIGRRGAISLLCLAAAIVFFVFTTVSSPLVMFLLIAAGGILGAYIPTAIALVTDLADPAFAGTAFGVALVGAEIGAVLGPLSSGIIAQILGLHASMYILPIVMLLAAGIVWFARDPLSKTLRIAASNPEPQAGLAQ